nr:hypothetical protein GCM10020092_014160 [Actinoplanes digitatis]
MAARACSRETGATPLPASATGATSATRVPSGAATLPSATVSVVSSGGGTRSVTSKARPSAPAPDATANAPADQPPLPDVGGPL